MGKKLTDRITWVGKVDWTLKKFHGDEYSTHKASSYNSYLVRDEKTALIDTVWLPYDKGVCKPPERGDRLKRNRLHHREPCGGGPQRRAGRADTRDTGQADILHRKRRENTERALSRGLELRDGKDGRYFEPGETSLVFVERRCCIGRIPCSSTDGRKRAVLQRRVRPAFATELLYNDLVDKMELYHEALKYYANILTPFSPLVTKKIQEVLALNLPVSMICPSHGVIWRDDPTQIVKQYLIWANNYQENQITLVFDSMWESTRKMAEAIAQGIQNVNPTVTLKLHNAATQDKNDIITDISSPKRCWWALPPSTTGCCTPSAACWI